MNKYFPLYALALATLVTASALVSAEVMAADSVEVKVVKSQSEDFERDVDTVALQAQEKSISKLSTMAKKYRGQLQEPQLLAKLAELQQQHAAIVFRISHGKASHSNRALDLSSYNRAMHASIVTIDLLIGKYPHYEQIAHAWFMRGKAYEEIKNKEKAIHDYLYLVKQFPDSEDTIGAYMSLADYAIEANDHARAISYLNQVEKHPEDTHYPFALYKLAWSYYNLKDVPHALSYAEKHIAFYAPKQDKDQEVDPTYATSDFALRENTLLDSVVFYFEGYEEGNSTYSLNNALPYFKNLDNGLALGRMMVRFAKLLRSHDHEADVVAWKDTVLKNESARPEALETLLVVYDFQLNKRYFDQLVVSANDMVKLYPTHKNFESFPKAKKMVLEAAEGLQTQIVKNKAADDIGKYSTILASLYEAFTQIVEESDPRIPRVHYNLAETLFEIKDFPGATTHYRWVVDHGKWPSRNDKTVAATVPDASLKAIASRYEVLRQKQSVPKELMARSLQSNSESTLEPSLAQWVAWIDRHLEFSDKGTENFVFESSRALYAQGHIVEAIRRLTSFGKKYPDSHFAIPSASLVIDTSIASENWEKTHELAQDFMKVTAWKSTPFEKRLFVVASDAFYKMVEAKYKIHDYSHALDLADAFIDQYSKSAHIGDCLSIAGDAAMQTQQVNRALGYYGRVIQELPGTERAGVALLARGAIEETRYQFAEAAADDEDYLKLPKSVIKLKDSEQDGFRVKILALTWLTGEAPRLKALLSDKTVCTEALASECEKYQALTLLNSTQVADASDDAFERARHASSETKALWAAIALENAKPFPFRDRNVLIRLASQGWSTLDPLMKFALVPHLSVSIPRAIAMNRKSMNDVAPLRPSEKYITHRVDMIHELENAATQAAKLPWARIRAEVLSEVAGLYMDLSRELAAVPPPKDLSPQDLIAYDDTIRKLTVPFEEKGQDIRAKAFELASRSSVDEISFKAIEGPFFLENPSQAKALKPIETKLRPIDLAFLNEIDSDGNWNRIAQGKKINEENPKLLWEARWSKALATQNAAQLAFFLQEAQQKSILTAGVLSAVKAESLIAMGARAEGLAELEEGSQKLQPDAKRFALFTLLQYALQTSSKEHSIALLKSLDSPDLGGVELKTVLQASTWAGYQRASSEQTRMPASKPKTK